ncbi:hypothetical protein BP6252_06372 [Coleophoma cylindrospora]|uniref:Carboxylic ester hydrolase n=1 Tax=Coleophoma cylindrospora TaxID=1849047 RepID=A0A3D8RMR4_9HELO|nr:hypothetical protein BP6252_06372 [Coleophoma cylindrospora]
MTPTFVSVRSALTLVSIFGLTSASLLTDLLDDLTGKRGLAAAVAASSSVGACASAIPVTVTVTERAEATSVSSSASSTTALATSTSVSASSTLATASATSGTVVLPYATYAAELNETYSFYKYSNIRFADPPTGNLRFKNPTAVSTVNTTIQDGSYGQTCYQLEQGSNSGAANQGEDCLFLDVVVPENIPAGTTLPVLFYIYGGGWHTGQKEIYDGSDLVITSNNSVIYVIPNYRLGSFGFLGQFGDANPGTMDQLFAMNWVQDYIHLFGGDPDRVTVAGHSAGAGCLVTHLVSNGGEGSVPFQQAVVMSPAVTQTFPEVIAARNLAMLEYFGYENYTQAEILALDAQAINDMTGHIGSGGWGPIIDGDYYREMPGLAFANGRYHSNLSLITGQLADEAHDFTPTVSPYIIDSSSDIRNMTYDTEAQMETFFTEIGFTLNTSQINEAWSLYPTINNTDLYYTMFGKYDRIASELMFDCYSYYMSNAYSVVYGWYFDVPPSYHAQENPYLFAEGTGTGGSSSYAINATLSTYMKTYLVSFTMGNINTDSSIPTWEPYSIAQQNIELGDTNVGMIADPSNNDRCVFWQTNSS